MGWLGARSLPNGRVLLSFPAKLRVIPCEAGNPSRVGEMKAFPFCVMGLPLRGNDTFLPLLRVEIGNDKHPPCLRVRRARQ